MTREAKESRDQAHAWDSSLNRVFQTMQGEDTAKYLAYFKARLEIEETYCRSLEKLSKDPKMTAPNTSSTANNANGAVNASDPEEIPTTVHMAFVGLLELTTQTSKRRHPFIKLLRTLMGALATLKVSEFPDKKKKKTIALTKLRVEIDEKTY